MNGLVWLGFVRQQPASDQPAGCDERIAFRSNDGTNRDRSRLMTVELEWRQEVHVLDTFHLPSRSKASCGFRKGLNSHNPWQHRCAFDLMVVQKRLCLGIERGLHSCADVNSASHHFANHRTFRSQIGGIACCCWVQATVLFPFMKEQAKALTNHNFALCPTGGQLSAN